MTATELDVVREINHRLGKLADTQVSQGELLTRVETKLADIPERVAKLEKRAARQDGERHVLVLLGGLIGSLVTEYGPKFWHFLGGAK